MTSIHKTASLVSLFVLLALFTGLARAAEIKPVTVDERLAKLEAAQDRKSVV